MVLQMQQINTLNEKIAIMNARHFGRSTGKLDTLPGQMNIYNEADTAAAETIAELVVPSTIVVLKAENRRGLRPPDVQKLQNIMLLNLCRFQQESHSSRISSLGPTYFIRIFFSCSASGPSPAPTADQADGYIWF